MTTPSPPVSAPIDVFAAELRKIREMKITDVEALHLRLPQVEEIADGTQDVLIIRIHTDAGLVGIGEVSSQSYVCKAIFEAPVRLSGGTGSPICCGAGIRWTSKDSGSTCIIKRIVMAGAGL